MSGDSIIKEAFSRVVIDAQLKDVGWNLTDGQSVRYEYQLPDGTFADYVLSDRHGRARVEGFALQRMVLFPDLGLPLVGTAFSEGCHCHTPFVRE